MATISPSPNLLRREKDSNLHELIHGQFITLDRSTLLCLSNYTTSPCLVALDPYHHSYLRLAFSFEWRKEVKHSGTERLRWGATSFAIAGTTGFEPATSCVVIHNGFEPLKLPLLCMIDYFSVTCIQAGILTNWTTHPRWKINKRIEEWENQFFVGVEPTTHNLNDYCSTTELEKRSNSFYDYLFKRAVRNSNPQLRRDRPAC